MINIKLFSHNLPRFSEGGGVNHFRLWYSLLTNNKASKKYFHKNIFDKCGL